MIVSVFFLVLFCLSVCLSVCAGAFPNPCDTRRGDEESNGTVCVCAGAVNRPCDTGWRRREDEEN